nr:MAG TPA: hypothetical protein [Caudoviricetes sp.]
MLSNRILSRVLYSTLTVSTGTYLMLRQLVKHIPDIRKTI